MQISVRERIFLLVLVCTCPTAREVVAAETLISDVTVLDTFYEPTEITLRKGTEVTILASFRAGRNKYLQIDLRPFSDVERTTGYINASAIGTKTSTTGSQQQKNPGILVLPSDPDDVNRFGLEMLLTPDAADSSSGRENLVISPYGIWANARLWLRGADPQTKQSLKLSESASKPVREKTVRVFDYVLKRTALQWTDSYSAFLQQHQVPFADCDFASQDIAQANELVRDASAGLITDFFTANNWRADSQLLFLNVVSLDAVWQHPFTPRPGLDLNFRAGAQKNEEVSWMVQQNNLEWFDLPEAGITGVLLPYQDSDLTGMVIVNSSPSDTDPPLKNLNAQLVRELTFRRPDTAAVRSGIVQLIMPQFTVESQIDVLQSSPLAPLAARGIILNGICETATNLTGMQQQVKLAVTDKGTKAAAATSATTSPSSSFQKKLIVDRPFVFLVVHRTTGTIFFASVIRSPRLPA